MTFAIANPSNSPKGENPGTSWEDFPFRGQG